MSENVEVNGQGVEMTCVGGSANKFWRVLRAGRTVATHYGRRGTLGQITVHHCYSDTEASNKFWNLMDSKERKGYQRTTHKTPFVVRQGLLDAAASTNQSTGNGGKVDTLAYALVAHWVEQASQKGVTFQSEDPLTGLITSGQLNARLLTLGVLAGMSPLDPGLPTANPDQLAIMACVLTDDVTFPTPAEVLGKA